MFYYITQNNSGGSFYVDQLLCHAMFIEADSVEEAKSIAENLGCYWNGVDDNIDCPCCGDRWYPSFDEVDFAKLFKKGYNVSTWGSSKKSILDWFEKYGKYKIVEEPKENKNGRFIGKIIFSTVEEYAQFLLDEYGDSTYISRIFYKNGSVKQFSKTK